MKAKTEVYALSDLTEKTWNVFAISSVSALFNKLFLGPTFDLIIDTPMDEL